jgi:hypothetical protein
MNFKTLLSFIIAVFAQEISAQVLNPPQIQWQRSYGATNPDICFDIVARPNGFSFIGFGGSNFIADYWLVHADLAGNILGELAIGGPGDELAFTGRLSSDGGFFLGGRSTSGIGGFKSETNNGNGDFWVVRLNAKGAKLWDKTFGSAGDDYLFTVLPLNDGGCVLGGTSSSISGTTIPGGNKTSPSFRAGDYWVIRLDASGGKLWETCYGTTNYDDLRAVLPAFDGGFLLAGTAPGSPVSTGGGNRLVTGYGGDDFWIIKIDAQGNREWEAAYGGGASEVLWCAAPTADGGYVLGGRSASSTTGVKTSPSYGGGDFWLVRITANGQKLWDRSYGGTGQDDLMTVQPLADGGFILSGRSTSEIGGNKTSPRYGIGDYWLVRVDMNGNKLWEMSLGGTADEWPYAIRQMSDGGWVVGGYSRSDANGNKTTSPLGALGSEDAWLVRIGPDDWTTPPSLRWQSCCIGQPGSQQSLILTGSPGLNYRIESSTDLVNWNVMQTNRLSNPEAEVLRGSLQSKATEFFRALIVQ